MTFEVDEANGVVVAPAVEEPEPVTTASPDTSAAESIGPSVAGQIT